MSLARLAYKKWSRVLKHLEEGDINAVHRATIEPCVYCVDVEDFDEPCEYCECPQSLCNGTGNDLIYEFNTALERNDIKECIGLVRKGLRVLRRHF